MIAAGIGCRRGCSAHDIVAAVERALALEGKAHGELRALYAPDFKRGEPGLLRAAAELERPLVWLALSLLRAQSARALTRSERVLARFGVPSIAETAALAGASTFDDAVTARLCGARQRSGHATCALAQLDLTRSSTESST